MSSVTSLRDELKEYHRSLGFVVKGDISESDVEEQGAIGFWIKSEEYPLVYILGQEERPFKMIFSYDMVAEIQSRLDKETARRYADPAEGVDDTPIEEWAAINILDEVSEEDSNDIDFRLRDILSSFPVWMDIYYTQQNRVQGFKVERPLFPEEESFSRSDYMEELSKVFTIGQRAQWFLEYTYNLGFGQHGDFELMQDSNELQP